MIIRYFSVLSVLSLCSLAFLVNGCGVKSPEDALTSALLSDRSQKVEVQTDPNGDNATVSVTSKEDGTNMNVDIKTGPDGVSVKGVTPDGRKIDIKTGPNGVSMKN